MKCLEKDRTRRYETASGLASDVERYLADEPVEACPPSAGYRLRKFARRNKAPLAAATVFAVLLLAGVVVSTWQAVRATHAETLARSSEEVAQEQKRDADDAKDKAEKRSDELRHLYYIADMNLARHAWDENNVTLARELLDRHRPKSGETDLRGFEWHYLRGLQHRDRFTLNAHVGIANSVAWTPDGKQLVSSGQSLAVSIDYTASRGLKEAKLWDAATWKQLPLPLRETTDKMVFGSLSSDGKLLAAGGSDKNVWVWNLETGKLVATLRGHTVDVKIVDFSPDGKHLVSWGRPAKITLQDCAEMIIWDLHTQKPLMSIDKLFYHNCALGFQPGWKARCL